MSTREKGEKKGTFVSKLPESKQRLRRKLFKTENHRLLLAESIDDSEAMNSGNIHL